MRVLLVTDIHGNLPALEAVLSSPLAQRAEKLVSTGDHTGFGPCPREVTERLLALGADILMGNHEQRLFLADTEAYSGYNWSLLHWTRKQMEGLPLVYPLTLEMGRVLFAHAVPTDVNLLLEAEQIPDLLAGLGRDVALYLSGHNHRPWDVRIPGRRGVNPGSLGMLEDEQGGCAPFALVDTETLTVEMGKAAYDVGQVRRAYVRSGAYRAAPELCRAALRTMETGMYQHCLRFVRLAQRLGGEQGISLDDPRAFAQAAKRWDWGDGLDCAAYWREAERAEGL